MLKKKQLALILLTLVMMLTIYYIKSPFGSAKDDSSKENPVTVIQDETGRLEELSELRTVLSEQRAGTLLTLDAVIANNDATVDEKTAAIDEKKYINNLTEKELLLELQIINKGYRDAFVHASDTGVEITVIAEEHTVKMANEIIVMSMGGFNKSFDNVTVQFQTVTEVSGKVA